MDLNSGDLLCVLKNRDSKQTVLKLVSYHPIKTFQLDLPTLMRTWCKIILIPSRKVSSQTGAAASHPRLKNKHMRKEPLRDHTPSKLVQQ